MRTVAFREMKHGSREDYMLLAGYERSYAAGAPERVLRALAQLDAEPLLGYQVTRLEHSLQAATRADRDGADADWVVSALLHDIGDALAPCNHDQLAAATLRPFVRDECTWVVAHHGLFQRVYYAHHYGEDPNGRDRLAAHPHYQACVDFCERWDQSSFDPDYDSLSLESFAPLVRQVLGRMPWDPVILREGEAVGLPPERHAVRRANGREGADPIKR